MKAYIFDLDGTLVDTLEDITRALNLMLIDEKFPLVTIDEVRLKIGKGARNLVSRVLPDGFDCESDEFNRLLEKYKALYDAHCTEKVRLYNGIFETIVELKKRGKRLAVISNKDTRHTKRIVEKLLPDLFDEVLGYDGTYPTKPAKDSLCAVCEMLSVAKEECVYIGDSAVDVAFSKGAGLTCVGVLWGFLGRSGFEKDNPPDVFVEKASEILNV